MILFGYLNPTAGGFVVLLFSILLVGVPASFAVIGFRIGREKGRQDAGLFLGLLLGPIGLLIIAMMSPSSEVQAEQAVRNSTAVEAALNADTRACPWCAETIKTSARLCRYCNREIEPAI